MKIECVHFVVFVNDNDKNQHNSLNHLENNGQAIKPEGGQLLPLHLPKVTQTQILQQTSHNEGRPKNNTNRQK